MEVTGPEGFLQAYEASLAQFRDPSRALMSDVLLIHGACHGAWCWDGVASHLSESGHRPIAVELPCDDPEVRVGRIRRGCDRAHSRRRRMI